VIWIVLHGHNDPSQVIKVDWKSEQIVQRITNIGKQNHHWIPYSDFEFITLSSQESSLMKINIENVETIRKTALWKDSKTACRPRHQRRAACQTPLHRFSPMVCLSFVSILTAPAAPPRPRG
jgi:hypothetical protein